MATTSRSKSGSRGKPARGHFDGIVGVGLCVVDHLLLLEEHRGDASRVRYRERVVSVGGMVATALAQAAQLGCASQLVTVVGDDEEGRFALKAMRGQGVGTRRCVVSARCPTAVATVLVRARDGERQFLVPDRTAVEKRAPAFDLSGIRERTILLVDGHYPAQALRAARQARSVGAVVIGDFSDSRPTYHELLPFVDYPIVPEEFGLSWGRRSPRETLFALRDAYGGRPVVTGGARGALALVDGRVRRVPAPPVRVRDTTGAGDVFHGAFAAGLFHGHDANLSLSVAAHAASLACTALGGQARLMQKRELDRLLARGNRRI